ncbi:hypothetical protein SAMN05216226_1296 [Halovenus aranensis]|uniref:Uncharacterized protein n=1 Tax=Halovenus aranensis TaxID=890420 RepID=A0A1G8ZQ98_9EURY|nr:hypothetical protein SAMN05216226_1296 [Halovenus aranensis]
MLSSNLDTLPTTCIEQINDKTYLIGAAIVG